MVLYCHQIEKHIIIYSCPQINLGQEFMLNNKAKICVCFLIPWRMKKISKDIEGRMSNDVKHSDSDFDSTGQWTHFWHL